MRCSVSDRWRQRQIAAADATELPDARQRIKVIETVMMATIVAIVALFVLYPIYYLLQASLDVGLPDARPPTAYGLDNFAKVLDYPAVLLNTLVVTLASTVMALLFGFVMAWILTRTNVPFKRTLDQLMTVPYYVTPLLGALAWSFLGAPESGFVNQLWRKLGGDGYLIDITSPMGIAWVMALFEGSVAYVMISAVMQSMDPALEEASQVMGASRWRTMWRVTLPLVAPGVLGAAHLRVRGNARLVLRRAGARHAGALLRHHDGDLSLRLAIPAAHSACRGHGRFAVRRHVRHAVALSLDHLAQELRHRQRQGVPAARHGHGRPQWVLFGICALYVLLSALLPVATLMFAAVQKLAVAFPAAANFTLDNFRQAFSINAVRTAMANSLILGAVTATLGVVITGLLTLIILRSRLPGRGALEYLVMFPQAVPRLVFAFGMMWAWLVFPLPIYATFWVLLIAYLTVFMPLGVRTISGVVMQLDKSLDECGQVCGATWAYRLRTITVPLLRPGLLAAWLLIFVASVRELGASILLMGPDFEGDDARHRRGVVLVEFRADRGDGADPDGGHRRDDAGLRPVHAPPVASRDGQRNDA